MAKVRELDGIKRDCTPTILLMDVSVDLEADNFLHPDTHTRQLAPPSPTPPRLSRSSSSRNEVAPSNPEDFYGLNLLKHIANEMSYSTISRLLVPIAVVRNGASAPVNSSATAASGLTRLPRPGDLSISVKKQHASEEDIVIHSFDPDMPTERKRLLKCLEAGATDLVQSPLTRERVFALGVHAYRAHVQGLRDQAMFQEINRNRKRSWVGVDEEKPYAYLRESMYVEISLPILHLQPVSCLAPFPFIVLVRHVLTTRSLGCQP